MNKIKSFFITHSIVFEVGKNIVEIIALIIAATWAIYSFNIKEKPALEKCPSVDNETFIDSLTDGKVHIRYILRLTNTGKTSFDVNSAHVSYWLVPSNQLTGNRYFSADHYMETHLPDTVITDNSFAGHYPPEKGSFKTFNFFLDHRPDYAVIVKGEFSFIKKSFWQEDTWEDYAYDLKIRCMP